MIMVMSNFKTSSKAKEQISLAKIIKSLPSLKPKSVMQTILMETSSLIATIKARELKNSRGPRLIQSLQQWIKQNS